MEDDEEQSTSTDSSMAVSSSGSERRLSSGKSGFDSQHGCHARIV